PVSGLDTFYLIKGQQKDQGPQKCLNASASVNGSTVTITIENKCGAKVVNVTGAGSVDGDCPVNGVLVTMPLELTYRGSQSIDSGSQSPDDHHPICVDVATGMPSGPPSNLKN